MAGRFGASSIPGLPSLSTLNLSVQQILPPIRVSDGTKRVEYQPIESKNIRPVGQTWASVASRSVTPAKLTPGLPTTVQVPVEVEEPVRRATREFPKLPIMPHGPQILDLLSKNQVIAVDAPTGTGKTRYLPFLISEQLKVRVRVAIPTTVAVRDAYNFIFNFTKLDVGYAAGRVIKYSPTTQLVYGTTGHFTQKIINVCRGKPLSEDVRKQVRIILGDVLFVDEVHTATVDITELVGLVNYIFRTESGEYRGPKLIFSSATFNHGDIFDFFPQFPIYKVETNAYPVQVIFLENQFDPLRDDVDDVIIPIIKDEFNRWLSERNYHGIIFRPGVNEVDTTLEALEKAFQNEENIEFYPAYSRLAPTDLDEIFKASSKMKIVIGTNIIESSITIEDVGFIVNDMLVKSSQTSATGGHKLVLGYISQAESKQRDGRTGRTMSGRAYHLCDEQFQLSLPQFRIKEIDRVPIYNVVLQLIDAGLSPLTVLKISSIRYDQAQKTLADFGMIVRQGSTYTVTEVGRFVSKIPLSIHNSYMVYLAFQEFKNSPKDPVAQIVFRTVVAIASMIEVFEPGYFYIPRRQRGESDSEYQARKDVHIEKYHEKFRGLTDIHTLVNIFWEMMEFIRVAKSYDRSVRGDFFNYVKNFAIDNQMNNKKLREMLTVLRDVEESTLNLLEEGSNIDLHSVIPDGGYENLGNRTAEIFGRAYVNNTFVRTVDRRGQVIYQDPKSQIIYRIGTRSNFSQIVITSREGPGRIIAAETIEVQGKKGVVNLCSILVDEKFIPS